MLDRAISLAMGRMYRACELAEFHDAGPADWSVDFDAVRAEVKGTLAKEFPTPTAPPEALGGETRKEETDA